MGIQKSQGTPYPDITRNDEVQRLILDGRFSKDDDVSLPSELYCSYLEARIRLCRSACLSDFHCSALKYRGADTLIPGAIRTQLTDRRTSRR